MGRTTLIGLAVALVVAGIVLFNALFTVHQTQQALVLQFGEPRQVVQDAGLHFKVPFVQNVITIDKRILDLDIQPEEVIASDQKRLVVDAFARFRITDPLVFFQTVGNEAVARSRLGTILQSSLRRVLGEESFEAVVRDDRSELMTRIKDSMNGEASQFGIDVVDVRIRRADLPEANSQAIFRRMQTEREREAAEFRAQGQEVAQRIRANADREVTVTVAESTRNAEIIRGEGDACRNRIFASAFGIDPNFFAFYRSMQSYEQAMAAGETTAVLSPDSEFFRYFTNPNAIPNASAPVGRSAAQAADLMGQLVGDATLRGILCAELELLEASETGGPSVPAIDPDLALDPMPVLELPDPAEAGGVETAPAE
ncbi:protease modulator HflC [Pyruvatibacter sp.]|uniref:protease modulator HflC n=1 Tax=Pyruvatibacter sp. TaxID=1981328 RepID=UPI0032F01291